MKRSTLRWGTAAAAAAILIAAWLLLRDRGGAAPMERKPSAPPVSRLTPEPPPEASPAPPVPEPASAANPAAPAPPAPKAAPPRATIVIEGKVVGLDDAGIPGVTLALLLPDGFDEGVMIPEPREATAGSVNIFDRAAGRATTDESGAFRFKVYAGGSAGLIAWGAGHAHTIVPPFSLDADVRGIVVRMEPTAAFAGRVMETTLPDLGHPPGPIAGARVSLLLREPDLARTHLASARTDAEGRFRIEGWPAGRYEATVEAPGFVGRRWQPIDLPNEAIEYRLVPARACALAGRVWLPGGAGPAAGVRVRARMSVDNVWVNAWQGSDSDAEGRFRIEGIPVSTTPVKGALQVEADAGARGVGRLVLWAWSGETEASIDLMPVGGATLRLRVFDGSRGTGRPPVAGVRLVARSGIHMPQASQWPFEIERNGTTDASGVVEFHDLPRQRVLVLPGGDEWGWEVEKGYDAKIGEPPSEGRWEAEIEVYPRGRVLGIVLGPGGDPVPGARVEVQQHSGLRIAPAAARTGPDGRFAIEAVSSQVPIVLRATADGFLPASSNSMFIAPGSTAEGIVIPLPVALAAFLGRVVDEEGKPRPGVQVQAHPAEDRRDLQPISVLTVVGGRYRIEVPAGTSWTLYILMKGFAWTPTPPLLPGDPVPDLVLRPAEAPPK